MKETVQRPEVGACHTFRKHPGSQGDERRSERNEGGRKKGRRGKGGGYLDSGVQQTLRIDGRGPKRGEGKPGRQPCRNKMVYSRQ